jgi:hypothetical protein
MRSFNDSVGLLYNFGELLMFLVHPAPQLRLKLDTRALYDNCVLLPDGEKPWEDCILISVKARIGYDLEFQVLTERGVLRDKLPISKLTYWQMDEGLFEQGRLQQDTLQRWCCPSNYLTIVQLGLGTGKAWMFSKQFKFYYLFTVDFTHAGPEIDLGDSQIMEEHKCMHIGAFSNGQIAALPNNSLVWDHPTLVTEKSQLKKNPGYKVTTHFPSSEWGRLASDSIENNEQMYDSEEKKNGN